MKTKRFYKTISIVLAIILAISCICPTLSVSATTANELKVTATSNLFPTAQTTFNDDYSQVTVTYLINSEKDMLNCEWALSYDTEKLKFNEEANLNATGKGYNFMPQVSVNGIFNPYIEGYPNLILGNATNLGLYPLSDNGKPVTFVTATFDIIGTGEANIHLDVDVLYVSKLGNDFMTDEAHEETIVNLCKVQDYSCKIDFHTTLDGKKDTSDVLYGDLDGDNAVTIRDATEISKYLADLVIFDENQLIKADFNGDGFINITDSTDIQKMLANLDYKYNH